jgi:hypothetical protein
MVHDHAKKKEKQLLVDREKRSGLDGVHSIKSINMKPGNE